MAIPRTCIVHGTSCPNEVVRTLNPDATADIDVCWDGYGELCNTPQDTTCLACTEAAAASGSEDVAWWCWMFGCSIDCKCYAPA